MFTTNKEANSEARDAQLVDLAAKAIYVDNFAKAESLLLKVIQNTPATYLYQYEENGEVVIKFWNSQELNQYSNWQKKQGINQSIIWRKSAYPRAFYFLGFLKIKTKEYEPAIAYLDQGLKLEPTNPKFNLEKAKALVGLQFYEAAISIYDNINSIGPYTSKYDIAKALQEKASVLFTIGDLDTAEQIYHQALNWEAENQIVISQLNKIQELRGSKPNNLDDVLPQDSNKFKNNPVYQSFLEQSSINQIKSQKLTESAGLNKLKNRSDLLIFLSIFIIIFSIILSLFI